eukprot:gnl/TRDRNA2_/TRDRNA2_49204_c0_seq1.p1 gnl/TRDRNA2_/TRDRNA2_49204_c0~~gnl/TRDRNA2_/TRDRNA2_49204_c0_seq1.p1  ORF type:complete len:714 (-),score=278.84 gnl/TRDRNA2_/TRDRNA2_49204_c0_seq1:47-2188(-)
MGGMAGGIALLAFLALAASAASTMSREVTMNNKERPIAKVVGLLSDMKEELEKEAEDDKDVFEQLTCWCTTNDKEKSEAIDTAKAKIDQLTATIEESTGKIGELKSKYTAARNELDSDKKGLVEANELRMKESKDFAKTEKDLLSAISAAKGAITTLSKQNPELAQLKVAVHHLREAKVPQMAESGFLGKGENQIFKAFIHSTETAESTAFLSMGHRSNAPASGQIFGILKQMKEDFEANLSEAQKEEKKAIKEYEMLKAAKKDEIAVGEKLKIELDESLSEFGEKKANAKKELTDTQEQLANDTEFLANLREECEKMNAEYDARVKSRLEEMGAVEDTIAFLNSDEAHSLAGKTVDSASFIQKPPKSESDSEAEDDDDAAMDAELDESFVQVSATTASKAAMRARLQRAAKVLREAGGEAGAPKLVLLATSVQLDAFTEVKQNIDMMTAELKKQQADEVDEKDWCIGELNTNKKQTDKGYEKKEELEAKQADLKQTVAGLTSEIESNKASILKLTMEMSKAGDLREKENADYQQTVMDHSLVQQILKKAVDKMKEVYSLGQMASGVTMDSADAPAKFSKKGGSKNPAGAKIVTMIETIIKDSEKAVDEAMTSEKDAQNAYEIFVKDSNTAITKATESNANMSGSRSKAKASLAAAETDFKQTMKHLEGLNAVLGDLSKQCDYLLKNFDTRQAARQAEIEALGEAKQILSGMK